jgi:invasion protein IalB
LQPGGERSCEVAQTLLDQRSQTLAQMVARRVVPGGPIVFSVQVGANATVTEPLRLVMEAQTALTLPFRRCLPRGCFAETQFSEAELGTLLRGAEPARLEFADGEGQPVAIPASLRGLAGSLQALRTADRN